ncbi:hypothetical protein N7495_001424 [Penicillium taxi]|uniref:uncharacterized protein n=1 Tax=Penicillium taxi TaxID=168475 RepID=UPI0025456EBC|nr:uncharacterized protein N7495_001424 [Penicillium taxi]KAJ5908742.1 hypothetical protein N7495_001424 [Penicillium taxi]
MGIVESRLLAERVLFARDKAAEEGNSRIDISQFWKDNVSFLHIDIDPLSLLRPVRGVVYPQTRALVLWKDKTTTLEGRAFIRRILQKGDYAIYQKAEEMEREYRKLYGDFSEQVVSEGDKSSESDNTSDSENDDSDPNSDTDSDNGEKRDYYRKKKHTSSNERPRRHGNKKEKPKKTYSEPPRSHHGKRERSQRMYSEPLPSRRQSQETKDQILMLEQQLKKLKNKGKAPR